MKERAVTKRGGTKCPAFPEFRIIIETTSAAFVAGHFGER